MAETVIVVGAGASAHYGYPVGDGLINDIIQDIDVSNFHRGELPIVGNPQSTISVDTVYADLRKALKFYDPLSIDTFLTRQKRQSSNLVDAGKIMIAYEILNSENPEYLHRFRYDDKEYKEVRTENWYKYLANHLLSEYEKSGEINTSIITFNYDVSLDFYLYSRFGKAGLLGKEDSENLLRKISENYIHVYGQVDSYSWQGGTRPNDDYGNLSGRDAFVQAKILKDNIFVIGEDRKELSEIKAKAKSFLHDAKRVLFLGFSFDEQNTDLLGLEEFAIDGVRMHRLPKFYYTNYTGNHNEGSEIIRQKINHFRSMKHRKVGSTGARDLIEKIESTKTVYGALSYDFLL